MPTTKNYEIKNKKIKKLEMTKFGNDNAYSKQNSKQNNSVLYSILYIHDSTLSEILRTASHVSSEQLANMQLKLDAVVEWSNHQDMVLNGKKVNR